MTVTTMKTMTPEVLGQKIPASFLVTFSTQLARTVFRTDFTLFMMIMVKMMTTTPDFTSGDIRQIGVVSMFVSVVSFVFSVQASASSRGMPTLKSRISAGPLAVVCSAVFKWAPLTSV